MSDRIDRYDIDRLRSIADWLASFPNEDVKDDALFIEDVISKIVVSQKPADAEQGEMTDIQALLREAADALRDYERDSLANQLEATAEQFTAADKVAEKYAGAMAGLAAVQTGEPAAWLVQHPKYMPEPCVEIADTRYHDHGLMETEKAQGWVFTPLYKGDK